MPRIPLGRFGFSVDLRDDGSHLAAAAEIEGLGFGTLWVAGGQLDRLQRLTDLLDATRTAVVGSAIISPDVYDATAVAQLYQRAESLTPGRLLIGLGSSQQAGALTRLNRYIDQLDAVPQDRRLLAALGPRALRIAGDRFAGAMPMIFTPDRTAEARRAIGSESTLSVGLYAILDTDAKTARAAARQPLEFLTTLPGYQKSLVRQGFSHQDIATLSDRLVDALVAWGSPQDIVDHAGRLHAAGADHVHFTVLGGADAPTGKAAARLLAAAIG